MPTPRCHGAGPSRRGKRRAARGIVRALAASVVCWAVAGCAQRADLGQVEGTVSLDGRPLARGTVTFETPGRRAATARIEDGRILDATTHRPGDGVPCGRQSLAVFAREEAATAVPADPGSRAFAADAMVGRSLVPRKYNDPATSGLTAEIRPGRNEIALELTGSGP